MLPGIDVSHHNGVIDWKKVAASGIKFAFLKASQGSAYVDPTFARNLKEAKAAAGLVVGAYHFFTPTQDATRQAKHFLDTAGSLSGQLPPVLDVEDVGKLTDQQYRVSIRAWVDHVKKAIGRPPIIYANVSYIERLDLLKLLPECPLWLACYREEPPALPWVFWQYTSSGAVDGIKGKVDLNWFRGASESKQLADLTK